MPWQECGECYGCPASSWHRRKCRDRHDAEMENRMMDEMERRHLLELDLERERNYLQSLPTTTKMEVG